VADSISIGISSLKKYPHLSEFLSQNLSFSKNIGQNPNDEKVFLQNLQKDLAFYKGKYSYEQAQSFSNFNIRSITGSFNVPSTGSIKQKKAIHSKTFLDASGSGTNVKKKGSTLSSAYANLKKIYKTIKRSNDEKKYGRNISLKTAAYLTSKPNTVKETSKKSALSFKDKKLSFRESIKELIAEKAYNVFQGQTDLKVDDLRKSIEESLFLIMDVGNIISTLQNNEAAKIGFREGTLFSRESLKSEISNEALNRMGYNGSTESEFFMNNIEAAAYLLESDSFRTQIMESVTTLKSFVDTFGENRDIYQSFVVEKAQSLLDRDKFDTTFLSNNIEFSSLVVGTEHTRRSYSLAQYLNTNPELTKDEFDVSGTILQYQAASVKKSLDPSVSLDENFFLNQKSILNVALSDKNFTDNLANSIEIIERFFSSPTGTFPQGNTAEVSEAYLSGLAEREE